MVTALLYGKQYDKLEVPSQIDDRKHASAAMTLQTSALDLRLGPRAREYRPLSGKIVQETMRQALTIAIAAICLATAGLSKEADPNQSSQETPDSQPRVVGKPVTTTAIKRCPKGYELVIRANGQHGCAKDVVPANE